MSESRPVHSTLNSFATTANEIQVGTTLLSDLVKQAGQTPFYAYDRQKISDRVTHLRAHLPQEIQLHYAIKANPMPAVVDHLAGLVDGFDLASAGEMRIALKTNMSPENISFAGPGKSEQEIGEAIAAGVTLNLESDTELERAVQSGNSQGIKPKVAVRVNPDFELKSSGMKMGGGPKPFGIDAELVPDILRKVSERDLDFQGLHIFSGSQNLKPDAIIETQEKTFALAYRLADSAPGPIKKLNIGGGFGIPYFPGEQALNIQPIGDKLNELLIEKNKQLPEAKVILELGRYLVGEAGIYVCKVVDRKISRGHVFLIVNGGMHHNLAASGNFGQVIRKNYPVLIGNKMGSTEKETVSIVGPLCTPLDILADNMQLPRADIGDLIVILQSGAYGFSASPHEFLNHPSATELLV